jgi:hypothetical protein
MNFYWRNKAKSCKMCRKHSSGRLLADITITEIPNYVSVKFVHHSLWHCPQCGQYNSGNGCFMKGVLYLTEMWCWKMCSMCVSGDRG